MDEVRWKDGQVKAQQSDEGPGYRMANWMAWGPATGSAAQAQGKPDDGWKGQKQEGPQKGRTRHALVWHGFPMGPDDRRTLEKQWDEDDSHPDTGRSNSDGSHGLFARLDACEAAASCDMRPILSTGKRTLVIRLLQ